MTRCVGDVQAQFTPSIPVRKECAAWGVWKSSGFFDYASQRARCSAQNDGLKLMAYKGNGGSYCSHLRVGLVYLGERFRPNRRPDRRPFLRAPMRARRQSAGSGIQKDYEDAWQHC